MSRSGSDEQGPPRKRRRVIIYSDSEDSEQSDNEKQQIDNDPEDSPETDGQQMDSTAQQTETLLEEPPAELDAEFLAALGDPVDDIPTYGEKIQQDLAQRWLPLLCSGMPKDKKEILIKEHTIPENCKFLRAPTLNAEISAAISDMARARDKKLETNQNQLGLGISAVGKGLSLLLTNDDKHKKIQAIKSIADGCRILSDLHFKETQARVKLITPGLDKAFLHVIQDGKRDESLFGEKLADKIKASKTIEKQGLQIKKPPPPQKIAATGAGQSQPSSSRPRVQGNWPSASRYQPSRRGGARERVQVRDNVPQASVVNHDNQQISTGDRRQTTCCNPPVDEGSTEVYPGCGDALRLAFSKRGSPPAALDLMVASLAKNTLSQYNVTYKLWWRFCSDSNHNPLEGTVSNVLSFLSERFNIGDSYGSLNSHRSALSLLLGSDVCVNDQTKRLLRGIFKSRPTAPKYCETWDPQIVLDYISQWYPNPNLSLEQITKKVAVLLALCTAHRVQTFSLIKLNNIKICAGGVRIAISDIIKTSAAGKEQPVLVLPYFNENRNICPATVIQDYIEKTKEIRSSSQNLLLTFKRPHKPASSQSISRWIKEVLGMAGVDVSVFGAHSTRHAATSAAHASGVSIDVIIRKTAGWTSGSQTFAKFYHRQLTDDGIFARSVCFPH